MVTGYEAGMYRDIERLRNSTEQIAKSLDLIAGSLDKIVAIGDALLASEQTHIRVEEPKPTFCGVKHQGTGSVCVRPPDHVLPHRSISNFAWTNQDGA
jgi:hypothetical protein